MADNPVFQATCAGRAARFRGRWDRATYQRMLAAYYGQIGMIDDAVGRLFRRLQTDGLWEDSLILFVSDHGDHNGAYGLFFKGEMYDSCARVPMLIKPPRGALREAARGSTRAEVVNLLDLYGTILDAAGDTQRRAPHIEARTLWPFVVDGAGQPWDNRTFAIIGERAEGNLAMLRRDHIKLIRKGRPDGEPLYELYDLRDAVPEVRNVFSQSGYAQARRDLTAELDAWCLAQAPRYPQPQDLGYRRRD